MVDQGSVKQKEHFFSICVFFHKYSQFTGHQGKRVGASIINSSHLLHPLYRHLDISQAITAEKSPLHIVSSRVITQNLLVSKRKSKLCDISCCTTALWLLFCFPKVVYSFDLSMNIAKHSSLGSVKSEL